MNSILDAFTPVHIANEVGITGDNGRKPVVLVEGYTDKSLLFQFFSLKREQVIPASGKTNLLGALKECALRKFRFVVGIVDSDELTVSPLTDVEVPDGLALVETGVRDADILVLTRTRVLERVIETLTPPDSQRGLDLTKLAEEMLQLALTATYEVGCLRRAQVSSEQQLRLTISAEQLVKLHEGPFDEDALFGLLQERGCTLSLAEFRNLLHQELEQKRPFPKTCRGHDVASVMAYYLYQRFGGKRIQGSSLEQSARLAFKAEDFCGTELHDALVDWQKRWKLRLLRPEVSPQHGY